MWLLKLVASKPSSPHSTPPPPHPFHPTRHTSHLPPHTPVMYNRPIRVYPNRASAKPLMAHTAKPLFPHNHLPTPFTKYQLSLDRSVLHPFQARQDCLFTHRGHGAADAPTKIGF